MNELLRSFEQDFEALVEKWGDQTAFIVPAEINPLNVSYNELAVLTKRCLVFFETQGLQSGDVIFSMMPNSLETVVCFLAAILGGYGFAPLPCFASKREIGRWISLVNPRLCITTDLISAETKNCLESSAIPLKFLTTNSLFSWLPPQPGNTKTAANAKLYLSTSGTTGEPKAMVLDANRLWSSGCAFVKYHGLQDSQLRFWNFLPMSYLGGLFNLSLIPLCTGGSAVIDETFSGKTFLEFWQTVERFDINAIWFVPTIVRGLLSMSRRTPAQSSNHKVKTAFIGTAPIDLPTKHRFEQTFGLTLLENFALSETTFFTSETDGNLEKRSEGSVGEVLPYADIKLVNIEQSPDSPQEIYVRSPFLFMGYLQPDGTITLPTDKDGYFPTGDLGSLNKDNILSISGRSKDCIKKGGYLVALREVEVLAEQHLAIQEAAAVKTAHNFYGESFDLYIILKPGYDDSATNEISPYIHEHLIKYKWPERIIVVQEFPKTASGKIQKHLMPQQQPTGAKL